MPEIKAFAFDLEGPAVNMEPYHFKGFWYPAKDLGVHFDPSRIAEDMNLRIPNAIGGGDIVISEGIARLANPEASPEGIRKLAAQIRAQKDEFYAQAIAGLESIEPREGFLDVVRQIRELGLPMAITSLTPRARAEVLLERSGIGELFPKELTLVRESVERPKPAPDIYLKAAELMGIHPSEQLVFEDSATGLEAARTAESPAVAMPIFTSPAYMAKIRAQRPVRIFTSWTQIDSVTLMALLDI